MDINTLLEPFSTRIIRKHIVRESISFPASIAFLTEDTTAEENCIYLSDRCCDDTLLPLLRKMDCGTVFLWSSKDWQPALDMDALSCSCIFINETPAKTYNTLHPILTHFNKKWNRFVSRLSSGETSLMQTCELAAAEENCAAAIYDRTGKQICSSDPSAFSPELERTLPELFPIEQTTEAEPTYAPFSVSGKTGLALRLASGNYLLALSDRSEDLRPFLSLLSDCAEAALRREGFHNTEFDLLMRDILDGKLIDEDSIARSLSPLFLEGNASEGRIYYSLCVLRPDPDVSLDNLNGLRRFLQDELRFKSLEYNGDIVLMTAFREKDNLLAVKRGRILDIHGRSAHIVEEKLLSSGATMCMSIPTGFFDRIRTVYILCLNTLRLHTELKLNGAGSRLVYCSDYQIWNVIDCCADRFRELYGNDDLVTLIAPEVVLLRKYDMLHNDYLSDILRIYLTSGRKTDVTAQKAFVHRNTVSRKLEKIAEITQLDLDDAKVQLKIMLSLQMLEYYESSAFSGNEGNRLNLRIRPEQ